jgi:hypothetical protein
MYCWHGPLRTAPCLTTSRIRSLLRRSRSSLIPCALAPVLFLASLVAQNPNPSPLLTGPYRIAGTLVSATEGRPLSRARVNLQDVRNPRNQTFVVTGDDGHFDFPNLPAGKYAVLGAKRGYITGAYNSHGNFSTAIVTGAGLDTEHLVLQIAPVAALSGHVFDESGDPVRGAVVTLWRDDHSTGVSHTVRYRNDVVDDQGAFEFTPLDAGTYFVSVAAKPWYALHPSSFRAPGSPVLPSAVDPALDVVYPVTYYAGATDVDDASPILLRGGDRLDLDLHLVPVPAIHVILHNPAPPGQAGFAYPRIQRHDLDGPSWASRPEVQPVSPGVFEIIAAPGKYDVSIPQTDKTPAQTTQVDIDEDTRELDLSSGQAVAEIHATVEVPGEAQLPSRMGIALRNAQRRIVAWQIPGPDHTLTFGQVTPGKYDLLVGSPSRAYTVIRMLVNGARVSGHSLSVLPGTTLDLTLTLRGGAADVSGLAQRSGKATAGAMVVLVPASPEAHRDWFRRDQSDFDGTFTLHNVLPGSYTVLAIADGWDLDWSKPAVLRPYLAHGEKVVVPATSQTTIQLPKPVEIQPK